MWDCEQGGNLLSICYISHGCRICKLVQVGFRPEVNEDWGSQNGPYRVMRFVHEMETCYENPSNLVIAIVIYLCLIFLISFLVNF